MKTIIAITEKKNNIQTWKKKPNNLFNFFSFLKIENIQGKWYVQREGSDASGKAALFFWPRL